MLPFAVRPARQGSVETRQVGSHAQPQMIGEGHGAIGGDGGQFGDVCNGVTLRLLSAATKLANPAPVVACADVARSHDLRNKHGCRGRLLGLAGLRCFLFALGRWCEFYADSGVTSLVTTQRCLPIFRLRRNPSFS